MDNLARPQLVSDFSKAFISAVENDGSLAVIHPLEAFLAECRDLAALSGKGKWARAALIADIAHFMCVSHGRHPGVIDHAATKIVDDCARVWLVKATTGFAKERTFLTQLTVAAGPAHSLNGQDKLSALLMAQTKSFEMLCTSDREGCPAGAALAFVMDWQATRPLLEGVALMLGIEPVKPALPEEGETTALIESLASSTKIERAMRFGADQMLAQQRGLWKIIAARHVEARELG